MQQALIRLIVLVVLLANQTLITLGWNPLPFSEEQVFEGVSSAATVVMGILVWWKNNSVTKEAKKADVYLEKLKEAK